MYVESAVKQKPVELSKKPIIKFLSAYIYPSSDPIFTRTESF